MCLCVCVSGNVLSFILEHWGVRWREEADEGRRREEGEAGLDFLLELTGLSLSALRLLFFSFFPFFCSFFFSSFVWPLSGRADCCVTTCTVASVCRSTWPT